MELDEKVLGALKRAVRSLDEVPHRPVPAEVLAPLIEIADSGLKVRLDVEASKVIGAPLVSVSQSHDTTALLSGLTKRQKQVAELIIEGLPNQTIAARLGISLATVKDHVHAILERLDLPSRAALIAASRSG